MSYEMPERSRIMRIVAYPVSEKDLKDKSSIKEAILQVSGIYPEIGSQTHIFFRFFLRDEATDADDISIRYAFKDTLGKTVYEGTAKCALDPGKRIFSLAFDLRRFSRGVYEASFKTDVFSDPGVSFTFNVKKSDGFNSKLLPFRHKIQIEKPSGGIERADLIGTDRIDGKGIRKVLPSKRIDLESFPCFLLEVYPEKPFAKAGDVKLRMLLRDEYGNVVYDKDGHVRVSPGYNTLTVSFMMVTAKGIELISCGRYYAELSLDDMEPYIFSFLIMKRKPEEDQPPDEKLRASIKRVSSSEEDFDEERFLNWAYGRGYSAEIITESLIYYMDRFYNGNTGALAKNSEASRVARKIFDWIHLNRPLSESSDARPLVSSGPVSSDASAGKDFSGKEERVSRPYALTRVSGIKICEPGSGPVYICDGNVIYRAKDGLKGDPEYLIMGGFIYRAKNAYSPEGTELFEIKDNCVYTLFQSRVRDKTAYYFDDRYVYRPLSWITSDFDGERTGTVVFSLERD